MWIERGAMQHRDAHLYFKLFASRTACHYTRYVEKRRSVIAVDFSFLIAAFISIVFVLCCSSEGPFEFMKTT